MKKLNKITFIIRQDLFALLLYLSECMKFFYKERHTICVIGIKTWDFSTKELLKSI